MSAPNDPAVPAASWQDAARRPAFLSLALALVTLAVFWSVRGHDFINFDDPDYVTDNARVMGGLRPANVVWAFTNLEAGFWHPLTWLSILGDYQMFGLRAGGHHLTSLVLHIANTILLFAVFRRMTLATWRSAFVAALFALHPLHVEPVVWAASRKDVLSTFFWLLTLLAYANYVRLAKGQVSAPGVPAARTPHHAWLYYGLSIAAFVGAVMSKTMVVSLPLILLLLDWWPLRRVRFASWKLLLLEKLPFFAISIATGWLTIHAEQSVGALPGATLYPLPVRLANGVLSYWRYVGQMFWPDDLAVFYPYPPSFSTLRVVIGALLLVGVTVFALGAARRATYLVIGWFWYLITLLPVIGLIQVGSHAHADRYTYLPLIGLFVMGVWGTGELIPQWPARQRAFAVAGAVLLAGLGLRSRWQVHFWRDSETLFRHTIQVTRNNVTAYNCLGVAMAGRGNLAAAVTYFRTALQIEPANADAQRNLAKALAQQKASATAISELPNPQRDQEREAAVQDGLGVELAKQGQLDEAIAHFRAAIRSDTNYAGAHNNLGKALVEQKKLAEAIAEYRESLRLKPNEALVLNNLGVAVAMNGQIEAAAGYFQEALRYDSNYVGAHNNLGKALAAQRKWEEAVTEYETTLRLAPTDALAHNNLARVLAAQGKWEEAIGHHQESLRLNPNNPEAHYDLGMVLLHQAKREAAAGQFKEALRLAPGFGAARRELDKLNQP